MLLFLLVLLFPTMATPHPWLLPTCCSCPLLLLACSYFPPMATPYLLFPTHQCSSLVAIPNPSMIPTYNHSSLVVPYPQLLLACQCSLLVVVPHLLFPTHHCSPPIVNPYRGYSPVVVPCPSLLPHCYSPFIVIPLLLFLAHHCSRIFKVPLAPCCYSLLLFPHVFPPPSLLCNSFWSYKKQGKPTNKVSFIIIIFIFYLIIF